MTDKLDSWGVIGPVSLACWSVSIEVRSILHGSPRTVFMQSLWSPQKAVRNNDKGPQVLQEIKKTSEVTVRSNDTVRHAETGESEAILDEIPLEGHGRAPTQIGQVPPPARVVECG